MPNNTDDSNKTREELLAEITDLRHKVERALSVDPSMAFYRFVIEKSDLLMFCIDSEGCLIFVNSAVCSKLGYTRRELLGMTVQDIDPHFPEKEWKAHWKEIQDKKVLTVETFHRRKDGTMFPVELTANYLHWEGKEYNFAFGRDVTEKRESEQAIKEVQMKLISKNEALENKNTAFLEVLETIEAEKQKIRDSIVTNNERFILPLIDKAKRVSADTRYLDILEKNLQDMISSFGLKISDKEIALTSREIDVCNMVRLNFSNKEISDMLNIALHTVEKHRLNIRKKLGLTSKRQDLAVYLKSLSLE